MADKDLYLSESPNVDKGFVEQDGKLRKTVLTAIPSGDLQLSDSANVSTGYVTDDQGKKHRVNLVAEVEGTLELPDTSSSDTGYVVDGDGKKHKVQLTATLYGGGSAPVIDELNVTPSTSAQQITAPEGTDGYSPVKVSAVTSAIDANIVAGNIKKDVTILGVTGSYEGVTVGPHVPFHLYNGNILTGFATPIDLKGVLSINRQIFPRDANNMGTLNYATGEAFVNAEQLKQIRNKSAMNGAFVLATGLTSCTLPSLEIINGEQCCSGLCNSCSGLTALNLPNLHTITGLRAIQSICIGCTSLQTLVLYSLTSVDASYGLQSLCRDCTSLKSLSFPSLKTTAFGSYTNQFNTMLSGCTDVTVHFPSILQSVIGSWTDVINGFSGTNTTVLFDLPATVTLTGANSVSYERNPKDDTATSLAWRKNTYDADGFVVDWTSYYTSTTNDPIVGDTIYSDSACTVAVTTISSIS